MSDKSHSHSCHDHSKPDFLLWGSLTLIALLYLAHWQFSDLLQSTTWIKTLAQSSFELMNTMWWGITLGILTVAALSKVPREFIISILGSGSGLTGILRATLAGVLLDLCSHGILLVGSKLYERGASGGQVIAFLIASPWNSFSLTLILLALIGLPWTLAFIALSMLIAIFSGLLFECFVKKGTLPSNPNKVAIPHDFKFFPELKKQLKATNFSPAFFKEMALSGLMESRMVLRWIFFGVLLAGLVRAFIDTSTFQAYFGPTLIGLALTVFFATIIEVCSEGSTPIAADLLTRAGAPGNSFAFLMSGVATDYTEVMVLKETTRSWKFALFLPLLTLPQVILIAWIINSLTV